MPKFHPHIQAHTERPERASDARPRTGSHGMENAVPPASHSAGSAHLHAPVQMQKVSSQGKAWTDKKTQQMHAGYDNPHHYQTAQLQQALNTFDADGGHANRFFTTEHKRTRNALKRAIHARTPMERIQHLNQTQVHGTQWIGKHTDRKQNPARHAAITSLLDTVQAQGGKSSNLHLRPQHTQSAFQHLAQLNQHRKQKTQTALSKARRSGFHSGNLAEPMTQLGGGQIGTVHNAQFNHSGKDWVYKGDERPEIGMLKQIGALDQLHNKGEQFVNPELTHRSVAASSLDRALGTNALVETHFASKNNADGQAELGQVMEKVDGHTPSKDAMVPIPQSQAENMHEAMQDPDMRAQVEDMFGYLPGKPETAANLRNKGTAFTPTDFSNPETQKSLLDLQASDYVTNAGADRHEQNYMIEKGTGRARGIDNDFAMGAITTESGNATKLPPMLHHETAQRLLGVDTEGEEYKKTHDELSKNLSPKEAEAAKKRLHTLQAHIHSLYDSKMVVGDYEGSAHQHFDASTYGTLTHDDASSSYIKRDAQQQKQYFGGHDVVPAGNKINAAARGFLARNRLRKEGGK